MADVTSEAAGRGGSGGGEHAVVGDCAGMAAVDDVPLLVRVLAGNPVTSTTILSCLNTVDASCLRRLNAAVAGRVAGVPWCDMDTLVVDAVRWRAAFPAAVGAKVSPQPVGGDLPPPALAALAGVTHLDLRGCEFLTDELLLHLPASLRILNMCQCRGLTERASFVHLAALTTFDCCGTSVGVAGLPPSLQELITASLPTGASLAHLARLRKLRASSMDTATLESLPPSLLDLNAAANFGNSGLCVGAAFAHLPALRTLDVSFSEIYNGSLASLPPSLVTLTACECEYLTPAAVLPHLPVLQLLDVSGTYIGNALVASLPAALKELRMSRCGGVTAGATLDHLPELHTLHSYGTHLAPDALAACRARGCAVYVAAGVLRGHDYNVEDRKSVV